VMSCTLSFAPSNTEGVLHGFQHRVEPVLGSHARIFNINIFNILDKASLRESAMSFTFTIFNHGTDFNADKNSYEIISFLHNLLPKSDEARIVKEEGSDKYTINNAVNATYMINMGVGSDSVNSSNSTRGYSYATPGEKNPFTGEKKSETSPYNPGMLAALKGPQSASPPKKESLYKEAKGDTYKTGQTQGRIFGIGWDDNVARALDIVCGLAFEHNKKPDIINIVGWSRGGVTSLLIANAIFEIFHYEVIVNVFVIDPVPGGATKRIDSRITTIPPNVNNYFAVIALDDNRANFQPTDRGDIERLSPDNYPNIPRPAGQIVPPNTHFLPLPGDHSCVAGAFDDTTKTHPAMRNVANLVRHLAIKFLTSHGTPFKLDRYRDPIESAEDVVFYYDFIKQCEKAIERQCEIPGIFKDPVGKIASGGKQIRNIKRLKRKTHVAGNPEEVMNDHHQMCLSIVNNDKTLENSLPQYGSFPDSYQDHPRQTLLSRMGFIYPQINIPTSVKDNDITRNIVNKTYYTNDNLGRAIGFISSTKSNDDILSPSAFQTSGVIIRNTEWESKSKASGFLATRKTIVPVDNALSIYRAGFEICSNNKQWTALDPSAKRRAIKHRLKNTNILVDACDYYLAAGQGSRNTAVTALRWLASIETDALISVL